MEVFAPVNNSVSMDAWSWEGMGPLEVWCRLPIHSCTFFCFEMIEHHVSWCVVCASMHGHVCRAVAGAEQDALLAAILVILGAWIKGQDHWAVGSAGQDGLLAGNFIFGCTGRFDASMDTLAGAWGYGRCGAGWIACRQLSFWVHWVF
eukprot:1159792-Pelagomonas_calceolata.AAC.22